MNANPKKPFWSRLPRQFWEFGLAPILFGLTIILLLIVRAIFAFIR